MANTVTEKQVEMLNRLQKERIPSPTSIVMLAALRSAYRRGEATSLGASTVISALLGSPHRYIEEGIYELPNGLLVRVYRGQKNGRMLASEVFIADGETTYDYLGLAERFISPSTRRLTREEVAERTLQSGSGTCMICGRRLDDPTSVDRGVGPVCWAEYR